MSNPLGNNFELIIAGIVIVISLVLAFLIFKFSKVVKDMDDELGGFKPSDRKAKKSKTQSLQEIFFNYNHNSTSDWAAWMSTKGKEAKNHAFNKFRDFLSRNPENIGIIATDVLRSLLAIKHPDSFQLVREFLVKIRRALGRFKHAEELYEHACKTLVKLNSKKSVDILKDELKQVKIKPDATQVATKITEAIMSTDYNETLEQFGYEVLMDPMLSLEAKIAAVKKFMEQSNEQRAKIHANILRLYMSDSIVALTKTDLKILRFIQGDILRYVKEGNKELFSLLLDTCQHKKTMHVFSELVADLLSEPEFELSQEDIIMLLQRPEPAKALIIESLCKRQNVNLSEAGSFSFNVNQEDFFFKKNLFVSEKPHKKLHIPEVISQVKDRLKNTLFSKSGQNNSAKRSTIPLFMGDSTNEKIFLARALSSNEEMNFIYIDVRETLKDNKALSSLRSSVLAQKPAIVFFDRFKDIFDLKLDGETKVKVKVLNKTIQELLPDPSLYLIAGVEQDANIFENDEHYSSMIMTRSRGAFRYGPSHDKAGTDFKMEHIKHCLSQLSSNRFEDGEQHKIRDFLLEETEGYTCLEFMSFMTNYFAYSILGMNKCVTSDEYHEVKNQFKNLAVEDERLEKVAPQLFMPDPVEEAKAKPSYLEEDDDQDENVSYVAVEEG